MDVLLISGCPPFPLHVGDRLIPYHLAEQLVARQHAVDLLAFYNVPEEAADIPRYERHFRHIQLIREPRRGGLRYVRRLIGGGFFPKVAGGAWSKDMWKAIQERIAAVNYDVIQLFGGVQVYEYQALVKAYPNLIVAPEAYSLYLENALVAADGTARLRRQIALAVARRYERRMFRGYDQVVVLTEGAAESLRPRQPDLPISVIPNGIDTDYFVPTELDPNEATLLFVGNFNHMPNLEAAFRLAREIFPLVKRRVPSARLKLIGNAPPRELCDLANDSIEVAGRVPDIRPYYEGALIFVSPLRTGAGIRNKILEAMAMQKPIVATALSCEGIALEHGKTVMLAESNEDIARAIIGLVKDGALRHQIAKAARELIEKRYTWGHVTEQYIVLYRALGTARIDRIEAGIKGN